jgi:hypothetical protein
MELRRCYWLKFIRVIEQRTAKGETDLLKKEVIFDYFTLFFMQLYASSYGATTTSISCLTHYVRVTTTVVI